MNESSDTISVLHVDDEPDFTDLAATFLEREDERLDVWTAASPDEGLELLADNDIDCIVSDYDMPRTNGIEFLEAVREEYPGLPFILYTGKGSEEIASEAISAGVTDYLQKEQGTEQYKILANRVANAVTQHRAEQAIEASEKRLSLFIEQSPLGVIEWNEDFEVTRANEMAQEILGYSEVELRGHSWEMIVSEADRDQVMETVTDLLEAEGGFHSINENVRKDGKRIVCEWHNRVVTDEAGDVVAIYSQFQDITERKEREQELKRYEAYLEESTDIVTVLDESGTITYESPAVERVLGYDQGALIGENGFDYIHPDDAEEAYTTFSELVDEPGATITVEFRFRTADDEWRWLEVRGTNQLEHEAINGIVTNNRDITERKAYERDLERTNTLLSTLIDALPQGVLVEDDSRDVLTINQRLFDLFELSGSPEELIGADCERLAEEVSEMFAAPAQFVDRINELVAAGEPVDTEELALADGRAFERTYRPIELTDGHGHLWVYRNVTDHRAAKAQLRAEQQFVQSIFRSLPDPLYAFDTDGHLLRWNEQLEAVTGYSQDEIEEMHVTEFVPEDDIDTISEHFQTVLDDRQAITVEATVETDRGDRIPYELTGGPLEDPDGNLRGVTGIGRDISERQAREQRLEALNRATRRLLTAETSEQVAEIGVEVAREILDLDANAIHLYDEASAGLEPVAGTDAVYDIIGEPPTFTGDDSIAWRVYKRGEAQAIDTVTDDPDAYNPNTPIQSELHLPLGEYGLLIAGSPTPAAFDDQDVLLGEILANNIVTALEEVERTDQLRVRERELAQQNDRLEAFTSIVSHDLRNPLNVAQGNLELAQEECDSEHLAAIEGAHDRMEALIADLLTLAREGAAVSDTDPVELAAIVDGCWANVDTDDAGLVIETEQTILADESRLKQLFENLIRNAIEHGGPDVTVTVGNLAGGFYIEDDGPGIPEPERADIFDAGYTTSTEGTGFGLSIVKQVAEAHGWDIGVTDGSNGGARFEITNVESV